MNHSITSETWRLRRFLLSHIFGFGEKDFQALDTDHLPLTRARRYVSWYEVQRLWLPVLNPPSSFVEISRKERVADRLSEAGLPVVPTMMVLDAGETEEKVCASLLASGLDALVIKPASGTMKGAGVTCFASLTPDMKSGTSLDGKQRLLYAEVQRAATESHCGKALVQPLLGRHESLADIAPNPVSTVRIYTLLKADGKVCILGAFLRLGSARAMTDNLAKGGIAARVDIHSGMLGEAMKIEPGIAKYHRVSTGPSPSKAELRGARIPYWEAAIDTCISAARVFGEVRLIGWDILVTNDGPVVIEANANVRFSVLQGVAGPLMNAGLRKALGELGIHRHPFWNLTWAVRKGWFRVVRGRARNAVPARNDFGK